MLVADLKLEHNEAVLLTYALLDDDVSNFMILNKETTIRMQGVMSLWSISWKKKTYSNVEEQQHTSIDNKWQKIIHIMLHLIVDVVLKWSGRSSIIWRKQGAQNIIVCLKKDATLVVVCIISGKLWPCPAAWCGSEN